jgi:hypothetical protein
MRSNNLSGKQKCVCGKETISVSVTTDAEEQAKYVHNYLQVTARLCHVLK